MNEINNLDLIDFSKEIYETDKLHYSNAMDNIQNYVELTNKKKKELSKHISLLPQDIRHLLYSKYIYKLSDEDISVFYDIQDPEGTFIYYWFLLSATMKIEEISLILEESLINAVKILYKEEFKKTSPKFKIIKNITRIAACILVTITLSFSVAIAVNAEFREDVIEFIYELFDDFAFFTVASKNQTYDLNDIVIDISDKYDLIEEINTEKMISLKYLNQDNNILTILIAQANQYGYSDTSNEVISITIDNIEYMYFTVNNITYLTYELYGNHILIYGNISSEELFYLAENIY